MKQEYIEKARILERELIGRLVYNEKLIAQASITKNDFYHFGKEFEVIKKAFESGKNVITEFITAKMMISNFPEESFRQVQSICKDIKEINNAIRLIDILTKKSLSVPSEQIESFVAEVQKEIIDNVKTTEREKSDINSLLAEWELKKAEYTERYNSGKKILGISTGYEKLDEIIDGIRPDHLWIIGGYTNTGKTFASLNIAAELIDKGYRVVYYSLEMGATDILARIIGLMTETNGSSILKGFGDEQKVQNAISKIANANLSIHTNKSSLDEILFSMYEENLQNPTTLFIVDFVQLVTVKDAKSEYETITASALQFQQIAKRLKTTVMLLSQISNEGAKMPNESIMSFKGSGALGAAADLAIEISTDEPSGIDWKEKMFSGEDVQMKWVVKKNRHGRVGKLTMDFNGKIGKFKTK